MTFGDTTALENQIYDMNGKATQVIMIILLLSIQKLIACERNIETIAKLGETQEESVNDKKSNIKNYL